MKQEFNLSEKIRGEEHCPDSSMHWLDLEDIKEFIKREFQLLLDLRDGKISSWYKFFTMRDKLVGDKLTK